MTGCPSYYVSRRRFLQAAGMAGFASVLGMPLRSLLAAAAQSPAQADHMILLWMGGGMSHIDTFDPKPGRATGGEFKPVPTSVPGIDISEILPGIAGQMKHACLVRSVTGVEGDHERARYNVLTGYRQAPQLIHPGVGSVVAHEMEQEGDLPAFIAVGGRATSAGYLGQRCDAYYIGEPGRPDPYVQLPEGVTQVRAQRRLELLQRMNHGFASAVPHDDLEATSESYVAARRFMQSPALAAFNLQSEPESVRQSYGASDFGRGCLLARRLVESGVRFVQVSLGGFDTHEDNFNALRRRAQVLDPAVGALLADLAAGGRLERTLVVLLSEFGRTPRINDGAGRDHHPRVFSALLAGGPVRRGQLIGASDVDGYEPADRPVSIADLHATICTALGIDPAKEVMTPLGRPMKLVYGGTPVRQMLAG